MIVTNLVSVVRKKENSQLKYDSFYNPRVLNEIEDLDQMVVMSATAKRKPLQLTECTPTEKIKDPDAVELNFECENFSKLRVPSFNTPRQKYVQIEEKLMNKSCEILFECIKPYKDVMPGKTKMWQSSQITKSILKTDEFIYEKKATRKVQFLSFGEESPPSYLNNNFCFDSIEEKEKTKIIDHEDPTAEAQVDLGLSPQSKRSRRTISSEDFINNAFFQI